MSGPLFRFVGPPASLSLFAKDCYSWLSNEARMSFTSRFSTFACPFSGVINEEMNMSLLLRRFGATLCVCVCVGVLEWVLSVCAGVRCVYWLCLPADSNYNAMSSVN